MQAYALSTIFLEIHRLIHLTVRSNLIKNGRASRNVNSGIRMASETRQKLIDTAIDLIWQSSYGAVSVDGICRAAGVKKGSFYHFFPSKADLAVAAMDEHFRLSRPALDAVYAPEVPPLERFANLADLILGFQEEALEKYGRVCGCPFASLGSEMAGQDEMIRAKTDEIFAAHQRYCETALREATALGLLPACTDTARVAAELCSYVLGQLVMARIRNDLAPMRWNLKSGMLRIIGVSQREAA